MTEEIKLLEAFGRAGDEAERAERVKAIREHFALVAPDPNLAACEAAWAKLDVANDNPQFASRAAEAVEILREHFAPRPVKPSGDWRHAPNPPPVLWRDGTVRADSVAARGEVAVLAGAGKGGKSYLAVALAVAAADASRHKRPFGATCGLRIAAGSVVVMSFEDSPKRIDMRAEAMGGAPEDVLLMPEPPRIYGFDQATRRWGETNAWPATWKAVREVAPVMVVIDTGPKAMGGETNDPGAVIGFLTALEAEARAGHFAVLVLAHDTKAARDAVRSGAALDAGAIAGSAQWHDSPRGVLHLTKTGPGDADRILEAVKCSYGRDGWGAKLAVQYCDSRYAGLKLSGEPLDEARLQDLRESLKPRPDTGKANRQRSTGNRNADKRAGEVPTTYEKAPYV